MKKYYLIGLLIFILFTGVFTMLTKASETIPPDSGSCLGIFADTIGTQYCGDIEYLYGRGVVKGYSNGLFGPKNDLSRGALAKIIVEGFGLPINGSGNTFPDVPYDHTFSKYIITLKNAGIVDGYSDGNYRPEAIVTKGEFTKYIVNSINYQNPGYLNPHLGSLAYVDLPENHTFNPYINALKDENIDIIEEVIEDNAGNYTVKANPNEIINREKAAHILASSIYYRLKRMNCDSNGDNFEWASGYGTCIENYTDIGKVCNDSTECQGSCLLLWQSETQNLSESQLNGQDVVAGYCANSRVEGCFVEVKSGYINRSNVLCID